MIRATLLHVLLPLTVGAAAAAARMPVARRRCAGRTTAGRTGPLPALAETVFWLHIQKTGTAFGATLAAVGCPDSPSKA